MVTGEFSDGNTCMRVFVGSDDYLHIKIEHQDFKLNKEEVYELIGCLELTKCRVKE